MFQVLKDKFLEKAKYVQFVMTKKFDNIFNIDASGLPRRWKPKDDVGSIFTEAKEKVKKMKNQISLDTYLPQFLFKFILSRPF